MKEKGKGDVEEMMCESENVEHSPHLSFACCKASRLEDERRKMRRRLASSEQICFGLLVSPNPKFPALAQVMNHGTIVAD